MSRLDAVFFDIDDTLFPTSEFAKRARWNAVKAMVAAGLNASEKDVYAELSEVISEFTSNYGQHFDHLMKRLGPTRRAEPTWRWSSRPVWSRITTRSSRRSTPSPT